MYLIYIIFVIYLLLLSSQTYAYMLEFDVFLTVHLDLFQINNLIHNSFIL